MVGNREGDVDLQIERPEQQEKDNIIQKLNNTIQDQNTTIQYQNNTIQELNSTIYRLQSHEKALQKLAEDRDEAMSKHNELQERIQILENTNTNLRNERDEMIRTHKEETEKLQEQYRKDLQIVNDEWQREYNNTIDLWYEANYNAERALNSRKLYRILNDTSNVTPPNSV